MALVLLVAGVAALTVATAVTIANRTNQQALDSQKHRLNAAALSELSAARREGALIASGRSHRFAGSDDQHGTLRSRLSDGWTVHGFNSLHALGADGRVVAGAEMGEPSGELAWRAVREWTLPLLSEVRLARAAANATMNARLASPGYEQTLSRAALIFDNFGLSIAVVVPFSRMWNQGRSTSLSRSGACRP